jgi:serine phosphatase RsbU (regulator of sigma subunit)
MNMHFRLPAWLMERPKRWAHLRSAPARQVAHLLLALFLLFSVLGFYNDLIAGGTAPFMIVSANAALCGAIAVAWLVTIMSLPAWCLIFVLALQLSSSSIFRLLAVWLNRTFHPPAVPSGSGIHFAATSIVIAVVSSYSLFARYIRYTGSESLRLRTELELAHTLQKTLVPTLSRRTPFFEIYGVSQPSEKVGGDLVDALELSSGDTVAYVADIAGHGLFSGILMGMLKTAVRTALRDRDCGNGAASLSQLMQRLNFVLPEVKEAQMYATLTALRLNIEGEVFIGMAASPPVLHWQRAQERIVRIEEEQFPIGLLPVSAFRAHRVEMHGEDLLVIATDGIIEVCSPMGIEFGIESLESLLRSNAAAPLALLAESILAATCAYGKQQDDQTLLLVRRTCREVSTILCEPDI